MIETSLAAVYVYSQAFTYKTTKQTQEPLHVTGGATDSPEIMRRVAGIWNRPIVSVEKGGAALGAAIAGVKAYCDHIGESFNVENFSKTVLKRGVRIQPNPNDVESYHGEGNYLQQFQETYQRIMRENPL